MRRRLFGALGVASLMAGLATAGAMIPGVAGAEPAVPKGTPFTVDYPAGELCAFPLELTGVSGQTTHDTGQGDILVTGPFTIMVINLDNRAMQTFNISGPTRNAPDGSLSEVMGPNLILQPASRNVGPPFLIYTTGRVTFTSQATIASRTGAITDVCAELT